MADEVVIQWTCSNCDTILTSSSWHTPDIAGCLYGNNHHWVGEDVTDLVKAQYEQSNKKKK